MPNIPALSVVSKDVRLPASGLQRRENYNSSSVIDPGLSADAAIGITITGVIVGLALLVLVIWGCWRLCGHRSDSSGDILLLFIILIVAFCTIGRKRKAKPATSHTLPSHLSSPSSSRRRPSGQTTTNTGGTPFLSKWSSRLDRARRGHARKNSDDIESVASSRDSDETLYDRGEAEQLEMGSMSLKDVHADLDLERAVAPPPPVHYHHREHTRRESM
ncbi:hypothetical protein BC629DRAFT_1592954 [Irpex lacteus]|nr:hypothetical protein BC629DRAFT_1592954 [Irpex lacteus]